MSAVLELCMCLLGMEEELQKEAPLPSGLVIHTAGSVMAHATYTNLLSQRKAELKKCLTVDPAELGDNPNVPRTFSYVHAIAKLRIKCIDDELKTIAEFALKEAELEASQ